MVLQNTSHFTKALFVIRKLLSIKLKKQFVVLNKRQNKFKGRIKPEKVNEGLSDRLDGTGACGSLEWAEIWKFWCGLRKNIARSNVIEICRVHKFSISSFSIPCLGSWIYAFIYSICGKYPTSREKWNRKLHFILLNVSYYALHISRQMEFVRIIEKMMKNRKNIKRDWR